MATLRDYMRRTAAVYKAFCPEYIKIFNAEQENANEINRIKASRDLTEQGKQRRIEEIRAKSSGLASARAQLARTAKEKALEIRKEAETRFYPLFHASAEKVDMRTLELLKADILTDSELLALADNFKGNCTMQRLCGKYMTQRDNKELKAAGMALMSSVSDPHLQCIDTIMAIGDSCMGNAYLSGAAGAEHIFAKFDELTEEAYRQAPEIDTLDIDGNF